MFLIVKCIMWKRGGALGDVNNVLDALVDSITDEEYHMPFVKAKKWSSYSKTTVERTNIHSGLFWDVYPATSASANEQKSPQNGTFRCYYVYKLSPKIGKSWWHGFPRRYRYRYRYRYRVWGPQYDQDLGLYGARVYGPLPFPRDFFWRWNNLLFPKISKSWIFCVLIEKVIQLFGCMI
jgi:hypothetical protein